MHKIMSTSKWRNYLYFILIVNVLISPPLLSYDCSHRDLFYFTCTPYIKFIFHCGTCRAHDHLMTSSIAAQLILNRLLLVILYIHSREKGHYILSVAVYYRWELFIKRRMWMQNKEQVIWNNDNEILLRW